MTDLLNIILYMNRNYKVEICANSAVSAINAQSGGADRVELCAGMPEGGTTPSAGEIAVARQYLVSSRLHVIIRPRGGDFLYSDHERKIMSHDIRVARQAGADGVVFGCLTSQGDVDTVLMRQLIAEADGMSVTFHRAFDVCRDPFQALEEIIDLGCERILTSGRRQTALQGIPFLKELVDRAAGRIVIMPGSGITPDNIIRLATETGATEFHLSARTMRDSDMMYRNPDISMGGQIFVDEYRIPQTDVSVVSRAVRALNSVG